MTPLHWAAKRDNTFIIEELLKHHAFVNAEDILERIPLFFAIENKNLKAMQLLINAGSNLWPKNPHYDYTKMLLHHPQQLQCLKESRQVDTDDQMRLFMKIKNSKRPMPQPDPLAEI